MAKSSRQRGIPRGVLKICPDGTHVVDRKASFCPYCNDEQGGERPAPPPRYNPIDPREQLLEARRNDESTGKLPVTRVLGQSNPWKRESPGAEASEPTTPPPADSPPAAPIQQIGPGKDAGDDPFSTQPYGKPANAGVRPGRPGAPPGIGVAAPASGRADLGKTVPLKAAPTAGATHVMVAAGGTGEVLGWLRCVGGSAQGQSWELNHGRNIIGSEEGCSLCIPGGELLDRHASVMASDDGFTVTLTDTHGSLKVNGDETEQETLVDGDLVELGFLAFRFRCLSPQDLHATPRTGGGRDAR